VTLLLGEPDPGLTAGVADVCEDGVLSVRGCTTAHELLYLAGRLRPELMIMRATLPDAPASYVIETLRKYDDLPIVVAVAEGETPLAGPALLAGATELTHHPYRRVALLAIVRRHLRTIEKATLQAAKIQVGVLRLDGPAYSAWARDRPLALTTREFELLQLLMNRAGRVVSVDEIRDTIWGARGEKVTRQTVTVNMHRLRARIADAAEIVSVRGVGYRLLA
jgi:DNA-binding response OmpR family regulator